MHRLFDLFLQEERLLKALILMLEGVVIVPNWRSDMDGTSRSSSFDTDIRVGYGSFDISYISIPHLEDTWYTKRNMPCNPTIHIPSIAEDFALNASKSSSMVKSTRIEV